MHWEFFACQWIIFTEGQRFSPDATAFRCNKWWIFSWFAIFLYQLYIQLLRKSQSTKPNQNKNQNIANKEIKSVWGINKFLHIIRNNEERKQQGERFFSDNNRTGTLHKQKQWTKQQQLFPAYLSTHTIRVSSTIH